jgi:hypothetical protein
MAGAQELSVLAKELGSALGGVKRFENSLPADAKKTIAVSLRG